MYEKILVPVDDIKSAGLALTNAKEIAKATGASIVLLHVVTPDSPLIITDEHVAGVHAAPSVVERAQQDEAVHLSNQQEILQASADEISSEGVSVSAEAVLGSAHTEIIRAVRNFGADLVILSTHGRRGVSRAFLGSVADEVVHDADVPVMLVDRT